MGIRLKEMRERAGYKSQKEAAAAFGVGYTRWNNWETEKNFMPIDVASNLCDFLGCTMDELAGSEQGTEKVIRAKRSLSRDVPIVGTIAAGSAKEAIEQSDRYHPLPDGVYDKAADLVWLEVSGNSMNRLFPDGSLVLVDRSARVRNGDVAAVFVNGDDVTVKRVYLDGKSVVLHPESYDPDYMDRTIDSSSPDAPAVHFFGKVVSYTAPLNWRP